MGFILGIDIGGTFTDMVVLDDAGEISTHKSPTTPGNLIDGVLNNIQLASTNRGLNVSDFLKDVDRIGYGTTAGTNAYIERRGATVGLLSTRGFEDVIFHQRMMGMTAGLTLDELTDYSRRAAPEPLCPSERLVGIRERVDWQGKVLLPLCEEDVRSGGLQLRDMGVDAVAICFLWSFKNPSHEQRAAEILRETMPDAYISVSSELVPRIGEYERTATTLVNAYLGPIISQYTTTIVSKLADKGNNGQILLLDSSGGVMTPADATKQPVRLLISGPSGGMTAAQYLGSYLKHENIITFDMGGTSTDVGLIIDGAPLQRQETEAGKYHLLLPMLDVTAIGAGGGSIARVEAGGYLRVGPESAGADPGPACYGHGGDYPTVTDADVVLGIIDPEHFLGGQLTIERALAEASLKKHVANPLGISVSEAAISIKKIVDNRMSVLLRTVTIERGHDPANFILYAFGGAGGAHAPAFALDLVRTIIIPVTQAVNCAFGAIASNLHFHHEISAPIRVRQDDTKSLQFAYEKLENIFSKLMEDAKSSLQSHDVTDADQQFISFVEMRFARQTKELHVPYKFKTNDVHLERVLNDFQEKYQQRYGTESIPERSAFEFVTCSMEATGKLPRPKFRRYDHSGTDPSDAHIGKRNVYDPVTDQFFATDIYSSEALATGNRISGPAIIECPNTTIALVSDQIAEIDPLRNIIILKK